MDYSSWMRDLAEEIGPRPIYDISLVGTSPLFPLPSLFPNHPQLTGNFRFLAPPQLSGSHNSASFSIDIKFGIGEFSPVPAFLGFFFARWSKCHSHDLYEQLKRGVRYIDLRVCRSHIDSELRTEHTVYGEKLEPLLNQIKRFLDEHPKGEK